jgi:hypothetical protein
VTDTFDGPCDRLLRADPAASVEYQRNFHMADVENSALGWRAFDKFYRPSPHYSRLLLLQARLPRASRLSSSLPAAAHSHYVSLCRFASLRCSGRVRDSLRKPSFRDEVS